MTQARSVQTVGNNNQKAGDIVKRFAKEIVTVVAMCCLVLQPMGGQAPTWSTAWAQDGFDPNDRDNDGVTNAADNCPDLHGLVTNGGCPDATANCSTGMVWYGLGLVAAVVGGSLALAFLGGPLGAAGAFAWFLAHYGSVLGGTLTVYCAIAYLTE